MYRHYNSIEKYEDGFDSKFVKIDEIKNIHKHYNLACLGCNILSMSKRIMTEVMFLAEDHGISIFYQDTDSCRFPAEKLDLLTKLFKEKYHRELIGKMLGQFHSDYPEISKGFETYGIKGWYCGKKAYMDKVSNDNEDIAFVCRLKGCKADGIAITANQLYPKLDPVLYKNNLFYPRFGMDRTSLEQLYEDLFRGKAIDFDLCLSSSPCFDMMSNFSITTKSSFIRRIQFK
jgi:hypothetical protein